MRKTDPEAKVAMKLQQRLKRKKLQQEALARGYLVLNTKQSLASQRKQDRLNLRIQHEQQLQA